MQSVCLPYSLKPPHKFRNKGGRSRQTSASNNCALRRIANANRLKSTAEVTSMWNEVTATPISRSTTASFRFSAFRALNPCSPTNRRKSGDSFQKVFEMDNGELDESKFTIDYGCKGPLVWRKKHERHRAQCLKRSVKHTASVMIWGCVSARETGTGSLCFLTPPPRPTQLRRSFCVFSITGPAHCAKKTQLQDNNRHIDIRALIQLS